MKSPSLSKGKISVMIRRTILILVTALLLVLFAVYGIMWILVHGPSPTARRLFVLSVKETSAGGFLAHLYLSDAEIEEILNGNLSPETPESGEEVDVSLISIPDRDSENDTPPSNSQNPNTTVVSPSTNPEYKKDETTEEVQGSDPAVLPTDGIEIVQVEGATYNGKLMIIEDPSRVFVGVPDSYGENSSGLTVAAMIQKYDCIAGTNAGGFYDPNGTGTGGIPEGIVIYEGELLWGELQGSYSLAGLDADGILHVGYMTAQHALDIGIQYAASYGPALVINGKSAGGQYGLGGGLNPRTAIGQRADGAILLMVINGRSIESLGATLDDMAELMMEYGAVNATNLDGGSSSIMIMDGEYLTSSAYIFGERVVATAILVK